MAEVRLEKLTKVFADKVVAVDQIDLHIQDKEFVTLVGPSGCGKSTTLRMIAGLERPTRGYIYFDDRVVNDEEPRDRNIAMVFQNYALYPHMNVRENLEYGLKKRRVPKAERRQRVEAVARRLQIDALLERKPRELSGGQRQRVALGRAIIRNPEVFLLDEPLSNLDAKLRVYMRAELITLHRSIQTTMIYVTHDQLEAMTMSDRIVVMNDGKIQQVGTPEEVYNQPANRFVAEFIGTPPMNFFDCRLREEKGAVRITNRFLSMGLPQRWQERLAQLRPTGQVTLGVRPEDIAIVAGEEEGANPATVAVVELIGSERIVYLEAAGETLVCRISADHRLGVNDTVGFRFNPAKLHLFDPLSGQALR
jgi:multiple sugar transport system ATP-binding protein